MKNRYRHTQIGWWTCLIELLVGALVAPLVVSWFAGGQVVTALATVAIFCLFLAMFYALTVEVSAGKLSFWFGIGVIRKSYPLAEIQSASEVKNPWYYFWGIKSIPGGWLYAMGPGNALEIALKNGKLFRLGSDEPGALKRAIDEASVAHGRTEVA